MKINYFIINILFYIFNSTHNVISFKILTNVAIYLSCGIINTIKSIFISQCCNDISQCSYNILNQSLFFFYYYVF
jgi:hypothetical protein